MAIHTHNTPSGVNERGLLARGLLPLVPFVFRPTPPVDDPRTALEILDAIRREIGQAEQPLLPDAKESAELAAARALHMRRELEQAARHGTALLAALGLPRLVEPGFAPIDDDALGDAIEVVLSHLDAIDAPEEDREPGGDDEPWLAWVTSPLTGCVDTGLSADDRELDLADGEPSLGAPEQHESGAKLFNGRWIPTPADQRHWADGSDNDREGDVADEPHDDDSDAEPSIGWPEDFTAKLDDVLQADHDPEFDDADLERSFTDAGEADDPVWTASRPTREVAHA